METEFESLSQRALLWVIAVLTLFHLFTLGQVPAVGILEGWFVDAAYSHYRYGTFDYTMFPGLIEYHNGSFGQGHFRFFLQSLSFHLFGFGLYQARLPMLLGGFFAAYTVYLAGRSLFGSAAGLISAVLFLLAPIFYNAHGSDSHSWLAACFVLAVYFSLRLLSERRPVLGFLAGLSIGIGLNFHLTGLLGIIPLTALFFYGRLKKEIDNTSLLSYALGGLAAFGVWCLLEIGPIGLDAFLKKSLYGLAVSQSEYLGKHWVMYFFRSGYGALVELLLFSCVLGSVRFFWQDFQPRFLYLFFLGLLGSYTLFSGSGNLIPAWAVVFVLMGGLVSRLAHARFSLQAWSSRIWVGLLVLLLAYYGNIQVKAAYGTLRTRAGDQYSDLTAQIAHGIPPGKTVMGSPLYWFGFVGRNPYITQNFYWDRMNQQTNELGDLQRQSAQVNAQKMVAFLRRRNVEYVIADRYFQDAIKPWIPEDQWTKEFVVLGEVQSPIYGAPSGGGQPPYQIQIWGLR